MRTAAATLVAILLVAGPSASAQKIDSLRVTLRVPKAEAADRVAAAFAAAGLRVSNSGPGFLEADEGRTSALYGYTHRVVRATIFTQDSMAIVQISGDEVRHNDDGGILKQLKIDNRAGGNGKKVWRKMVAAAMALDSASVPQAAIEP
jgi:hypothetical protein